MTATTDSTSAPHGPYWTRGQAAAAINGADGRADHAKRRGGLIDALNETGTKAGVFDLEILDWLAATWEPETVQVFVGLIRRARASADAALRTELDDLHEHIAILEAAAKRAIPAGTRVSTRYGIGTVVAPDAVAVEFDVPVPHLTVEVALMPAHHITLIDNGSAR